MQWLNLPVDVAHGVLKESSDVLKSTEPLSIVTGFLHILNELGKVAVSLFGESTADHVGTLVDVGYAVEKSFNTGETLTEVRLGVLPIVEVLSHFILNYNNYIDC